MHRLLRRKVLIPVVALLLVLAAVGLWLFQPWKLFTRSTVDEAVPFAPPATTAPPVTGNTLSVVVPTSAAGPRVLAEGRFVSQEHATSAVARVLEQDGARVLRLEGFSTSDGPDVHVWLSSTPAGGEWDTYDDGRYVALGKLKGTDGNQNYAIPADADLAGLRSAVIWCDRFNVAFGSADLAL